MKIAKRIALVVGILVVLLLGAAFALPYFFKDRLLATAQEEINKNVNAVVEIGDVSLSLFRRFPNISFALKDFSVRGIETFEGITLAEGASLEVVIDLFSVFPGGKPVALKSVHMQEPKIKVYVLEDGTANYNIAKPAEAPETTEPAAEPADFLVELRKYSITDGTLLYDDKDLGVFVDLRDLDHEGSGKFTLDVYDLDTRTSVGELTTVYGGIMYLKDARTQLEAILNIDQKSSKYTLKDNNLIVNDLQLAADGFVQLDGDNTHMDLRVTTPQNEFKNLLSLIPNAYIEGYENVKADGQFNLGASITGTYNGLTEQYPAFTVDFGIANGNVQYPDLPLGISGINAKASINSPSSDLDDIVVDVPELALKIGNNPFRAVFNLKTPISDPAIDATADGVINLGELARAFPMEGIEKLSGIITADLAAKTRLSMIEQQKYDQVNMSGDLRVQQLDYQASGMPLVRINDMQAAFSPQRVNIPNFDAKLGKSDLKASGSVDNILAYFSPKKTMKGQFTVRSNYFDVNEWMPEETEDGEPVPATANNGTEEEAATPEAPVAIFDRFDFSLDARMNKIEYADYELEDVVAKGNMKPNRLEIDQAGLVIGNSDVNATGVITGIFDYLFDNGMLGGNINVRSKFMDLNQFMTATDSGSTSSTTASNGTSGESTPYEPFLVPENVDIRINADVERVKYTNVELRDLTGNLIVADQAVVLDGVSGKTFGGLMMLNGGYDTKNQENPAFNIKYDMQRMDFQETFHGLNTFQRLAPIGRFIDGIFNTSLIMEGKLGKNMMPEWNSLSAKGFLETIQGVINDFKPLQEMGNSLRISELKEAIPLKDTRNWFEISNGFVELKPFDLQFKGIDMTIGGKHGITQDMDYNIKARVPRKMIESTGVGAAAGAGLAVLQKEASRLGIDMAQGEYVNVLINLTGKLQKPQVKVKLLGLDDDTSLAETAEAKLGEEVTKAKEELRQEAGERLEEGKKVVEEKAGQVLDTAKAVAEEKLEKVKQEAAKKAGEILGKEAGKNLVDSTAQQTIDTLLKGTDVDQIKKELEKFNPFKKKKQEEKKQEEKKTGNN